MHYKLIHMAFKLYQRWLVVCVRSVWCFTYTLGNVSDGELNFCVEQTNFNDYMHIFYSKFFISTFPCFRMWYWRARSWVQNTWHFLAMENDIIGNVYKIMCHTLWFVQAIIGTSYAYIWFAEKGNCDYKYSHNIDTFPLSYPIPYAYILDLLKSY